MITLRFKHDDQTLRAATLKAAHAMELPVRHVDRLRFDVDLVDAEQCYRFGSSTAMHATQEIMRQKGQQ
jgi:hypothetical protein